VIKLLKTTVVNSRTDYTINLVHNGVGVENSLCSVWVGWLVRVNGPFNTM